MPKFIIAFEDVRDEDTGRPLVRVGTKMDLGGYPPEGPITPAIGAGAVAAGLADTAFYGAMAGLVQDYLEVREHRKSGVIPPDAKLNPETERILKVHTYALLEQFGVYDALAPIIRSHLELKQFLAETGDTPNMTIDGDATDVTELTE